MVRGSIKMNAIMPVVDSWELVKRKDSDWSENFGVLVFEKLLKASPLSLRLLLPFAMDGEKPSDRDQFKEVATETASLIDFIVSSLGADMEFVKMQLSETFESHENFARVRPEHWNLVGQAVMEAMEETLGEAKWDTSTADCWATTCDYLSTLITEEILVQ